MPTLDELLTLADQLLEIDDSSPATLDALERLADRVDVLRASGAPEPPRRSPIRQTTPVQTGPRTTGARITTGLDRRPLLYGGESALPALVVEGVRRSFAPGAGAGRTLLATLHATDGPRLGRDPVENAAFVASARAALTASGGLCQPVPINYEQRVVSSTARPVRDGLVSFLAQRGGIKYYLPPGYHDGDAASGVDVWTHANDVNPTDPTTKPYVTITCTEDEQDVKVSAITQSMRLGTYVQRWEPERVQAWLDVLAAEHAALGEETLLAEMVSGSKSVTVGQTLGTSSDVLTALDRVGSMFRNRHRMSPTAQLDMIAPAWLRDEMRADLARRAPGDNQLAVSNAQLTEMFAVRNVRPIWSLDYQRNDSTQGVGPALGYPSIVDVLLYAPGSWIFLDGGVLDFGIMRDFDLVKTNEAQFFAESFERAAFIGGPNESLRLRLDVCANGGYASALDITPCVSGS